MLKTKQILGLLFFFLCISLLQCSSPEHANSSISSEVASQEKKRGIVGVWVGTEQRNAPKLQFTQFYAISENDRFWCFSFEGSRYTKLSNLPIIDGKYVVQDEDTILSVTRKRDSLEVAFVDGRLFECENWQDDPVEFVTHFQKRDSVKQLLSRDWRFCESLSSEHEIRLFGKLGHKSILHFGKKSTEIWIIDGRGEDASKRLNYNVEVDKFSINEESYVLAVYPIFKVTSDSLWLKNYELDMPDYSLVFVKLEGQ